MRWTKGVKFGLAAVIASAACDVPQEPIETEERGYVIYNGWGCRTCGYKNSPSLGAHAIADFTLGQQGGPGMALVSIEDTGGSRYDVTIEAEGILALTSKGIRSGTSIVGWSLIFERPSGGEIPVVIELYEEHPDWVAGDPIPTYGLSYLAGPTGEGVPASVCEDTSLENTSVVFLVGERYDQTTKTVIPGQSDYVSAACRDHALMKLKFTGHDPTDAYGSSPEERQAGLKMFTADYCGTGESFTKFGVDLDWQDRIGNFPGGWGLGLNTLEARWDEDGARCLGTPRYANRDHVLDRCELAGVELEACGGDPLDLDGFAWGSYLP
ncbi:MAG: ADYC domain-containing protein [Myxococcota bacterium]